MNADLIEKSQKLGEKVVRFCKNASKDAVTQALIPQLVKSAGNIGANLVKLDEKKSKHLTLTNLNSCKAHCQETKHWARLFAEAESDSKEECREIWKEANEINLSLAEMITKMGSENSSQIEKRNFEN